MGYPERFTPTRVGITGAAARPPPLVNGSPPRVWG